MRVAMVFCACVSVVAASSLSAEPVFTPVIFSGSAAPGISGRTVKWLGAPGISSDGTKVILSGQLNTPFYDPGGVSVPTNELTFWYGPLGALSLVADSNTIATDGSRYGDLDARQYVADSDGHVAFVPSSLQTNTSKLWGGTPGAIVKVAGPGEAAAGIPGKTYGGYFRGLSVNGTGQLAFQCFSFSGTGSTLGSGIWMGPVANIKPVAYAGMTAPGTGAPFFGVGMPTLSNAGVIFAASLGAPAPAATSDAVWVGTPDVLSMVARRGFQAAGMPAGVNYDSFHQQPAINDAGQVAFGAGLAGAGVSTTNNHAIWQGLPATIHSVARTGDAAPGTSPGVILSALSHPLMSANGATAFRANLSGPGVVPGQNEQALFCYDQGQTRLIARRGDVAPGTSATFDTIGDPMLNASGEMAFYANLVGDAPSLSGSNDGIWFADTQGELSLVVRAGQTVDLGGGDLRTISGLNFASNGFSAALPVRALSDNDTIAFGASFTDGPDAILLVSVPEPTGLLACIAFSPILLRRKRIRKWDMVQRRRHADKANIEV